MTACIACALAGVCQPGVFVVDDDAAIRDSLVFLLASLGHPVQAMPTDRAASCLMFACRG